MGRVFEDMNEPKSYREVKALFAECEAVLLVRRASRGARASMAFA